MKRQDEEKSAVGYVRVSSDEQVEGLSIESQKAKIREWCSTRGYKLTGFFADEGESAYNDDAGKRPGFATLLEELPVLQPDVVVVFSLDRWARSTVVSSQTFRLLANLQIGFASVSEAQWNFADPSARLVLNILANFAEFSSASTGQHVRRVSDLKFEKGLHRGSIPFGYRRDPTSTRADPRPPLPEEFEYRAVVELFRRALTTTETCGQLADWLNRQGFTTRNRKKTATEDSNRRAGWRAG